MQILELLISGTLVLITLSGAGWVLHAEWDRARCAYVVFEKTHARLNGGSALSGSPEIRVSEDPDGFSGEGRCGKAQERVRFRKLERSG